MGDIKDSEEKKMARIDVHDRIRVVDSYVKSRVKRICGNVRTCAEMKVLKEIQRKYDEIMALYPEHNFDLTRHIPYVSLKQYEIMRIKDVKTFNKRELKADDVFDFDSEKVRRLEESVSNYIEKKRKEYRQFFTDEGDKVLYDNDMSGLIFHSRIENIDGVEIVYTGLLNSKGGGYVVRYHSGMHGRANTRDPDTGKQISFRSNCIVNDVVTCTVINDIPRKKRSNRLVETQQPVYYLTRPEGYRLSEIEIYKVDGEEVEAPEETEIYL